VARPARDLGRPDAPLRIAMLSKATSPGGGASRVATELAALLRADGQVCDHWVGYYSQAPRPHLRQLHGDRTRPAIRQLRRLADRLGVLDALPLEALVLRASRVRYDVIHVHDIATAITSASIARLAAAAPLAWTFHDQSAFTGGCLYALECDRYRADCADCPRRGEWPLSGPAAGIRRARRLRRELARGGSYAPLAPSRWMADQAAATGDFPRGVEVIPNGVDTDLFRPPDDRAALRRMFDIPERARVALLSAGHLADPRKGGPDALRALATLPGGCVVLAVGNLDDAVRAALAPLDHRATGYIHDPARLAAAYGCADVNLFCSHAENHPLTILEAQACGVPTVAYAVGGIPEIVDAPELGALAPPGDAAALAAALARVLDAAGSLRKECRESAERRFSHALLLRRHLALYRRLAGRESAAP